MKREWLPYVVFVVLVGLTIKMTEGARQTLARRGDYPTPVGLAVFFALATIVVPILMMIQNRRDGSKQ